MESYWVDLEHRPLRSLRVGVPRPGRLELVMVPGLGALGYLLPLVRACAGWTRVHLLDVPGFGDARTSRLPAALPDVVRDVTAWLDAVPHHPVLLAGHSTGGQAALQVALARPERAASLLLAGPTFPPEARRWRRLATGVLRTLPHEPLGLIRATAPQYLRGRGGVLTLLRTAMHDAPESRITRLSCPVTIVRGAHDGICSEHWAQTLAQRAPSGRCITVPGAHNFPYSEPLAAMPAFRETAAS